MAHNGSVAALDHTGRGSIGIVTGVDTKAGREAAEGLASEGMSLMLVSSPGIPLHEWAEELSAAHDIRCMAAAIDVTDLAAVERVLMHTEQHLGPIDVVMSTVPGVLAAAVTPALIARGRGPVVHLGSRD